MTTQSPTLPQNCLSHQSQPINHVQTTQQSAEHPHSQHLSPIHSPHPSQPLQRVITSNSLPTNVSKQTTHTIWETQYSRLFKMQSLIGLLRRSTIIPVSLHRLVMNRMIVVKYGVGRNTYHLPAQTLPPPSKTDGILQTAGEYQRR